MTPRLESLGYVISGGALGPSTGSGCETSGESGETDVFRRRVVEPLTLTPFDETQDMLPSWERGQLRC
jgi:hypothetical protein